MQWPSVNLKVDRNGVLNPDPHHSAIDRSADILKSNRQIQICRPVGDGGCDGVKRDAVRCYLLGEIAGGLFKLKVVHVNRDSLDSDERDSPEDEQGDNQP